MKLNQAIQPRMDTDEPGAAPAATPPSPPSEGGEGRGEEAGAAARQVAAQIFGTPLSPTLSPSEGERESERRWTSLSEGREPSSWYYGCRTLDGNKQFPQRVRGACEIKSVFIRVHPWLKVFAAFSSVAVFLTALARAEEAAPTNTKAAGTETRISSKTVNFDLKSRSAVYRGNVVVEDPRVNVTCDLLTARLPTNGTRVDSIIAESNVVMLIPEKGATNRATADKAVYTYSVNAGVTNEVLELTGSPAIETPQGTMTGTKITWDRARDNISATDSHMSYRPSTNTPPAEVSTNAAPEPKPSTP